MGAGGVGARGLGALTLRTGLGGSLLLGGISGLTEGTSGAVRVRSLVVIIYLLLRVTTNVSTLRL